MTKERFGGRIALVSGEVQGFGDAIAQARMAQCAVGDWRYPSYLRAGSRILCL